MEKDLLEVLYEGLTKEGCPNEDVIKKVCTCPKIGKCPFSGQCCVCIKKHRLYGGFPHCMRAAVQEEVEKAVAEALSNKE